MNFLSSSFSSSSFSCPESSPPASSPLSSAESSINLQRLVGRDIACSLRNRRQGRFAGNLMQPKKFKLI
jgi:hypothetical protein